MLVDLGSFTKEQAKTIYQEYQEIVSMLVASRKTLRERIQMQGSKTRERRKPYRRKSSNQAIEQSSNEKD